MKIWVRLGLLFYIKKSSIKFKEIPGKPVILACNHPNSFLDALIIGSHYKKPVHFLARGDAFSNPVINRALRSINMIPIFRGTEGKEQLKNNEASFIECIEVLKKNGSLLIFSEGVCKNEWIVRPLKKGTARLAFTGWYNEGIKNLAVIPITLSYSSFSNIPIKVFVKEGTPILQNHLIAQLPPQFNNEFNKRLKHDLETQLLSQEELIKGNETSEAFIKMLLAIPALVGYITHKPYYNLCRRFAQRKTEGTVFFHSVLFGIFLLTYPLILLLITGITVLVTHNIFAWLLILLLPFTALCYKQYKS